MPTWFFSTMDANIHYCLNKAVRRVLAALMAVGLTAGCGGDSVETSTVSGTVTLGGKPIPPDAEAHIRFSSNEHPQVEPVSVPIEGGRYEATGVPQGEVTVTFNIIRYGPEKMSERTGEPYRDQINLLPPNVAAGVPHRVSGEAMTKDFAL